VWPRPNLFSPNPVLAEWVWTGGPSREFRLDAMLARRNLMLGALHAGHGIGAAFDFHVESGPATLLSLTCATTEATRWVARVFIPAYGRTSWVRISPSPKGCLGTPEWGRRIRSWPERLREGNDGLPAISHLLLTMAMLPVGIRLRWTFSPSRATWGYSPDRGREPEDSTPPMGGGRNGAPTLRPRSNLPPRDRARPLFWASTVELRFPPEVSQNSVARDRARAAVEGAIRSGRANGVRFSPLGWRPWGGRPCFEISEDELFLILPDAEGPSVTPPPNHGPRSQLLPLGRSDAGIVIGLPIEPAQGRHVAVLGETGMGKSATLVALGLAAKEFGGVVLFDPLGETAHGFVRELAPGERRDRLLWVSPRRQSGALNALEGLAGPGADPVFADRRLDDLIHALRRVRSGRYDSTYWGPRLEEMLTRALAAAATFPAGTLTDAHTLLATAGRGRQVVPPEAREAVGSLVDRVRERPEDAEGARRLLYEVVRSPVLRRMLAEPRPRLHATELVAPGRITVISGDASMVGESAARYLLAVHLALLWSELLARPVPSKTFVLLDETQWFAHESLAEMLRLARRRNVHVILATQTVSSLPEQVRDAVWTNVSDLVAFRGSPEEARELARATSRISPEEILSLPRGHAAVLIGKGNSVAWVRAVGRPSGPESPQPRATSVPGAGAILPMAVNRTKVHREDDPEIVLEWLRSRAREADGEGPIEVMLSELRASVDPNGHAIRAAGSLLGRAGALLRSSHQESGSVWTLDPRRFPAEPPGTPSATARGDAEETQPS